MNEPKKNELETDSQVEAPPSETVELDEKELAETVGGIVWMYGSD